jgi:hypothetical protein
MTRKGRRREFQTKYLVPLKTRINPMKMTETAAIRSPRKRIRSETRETERPAKNRAGTVPAPKRTIVRKPARGWEAVAALTIMAQESMQGRKPVAMPRRIFEERLRERNRGVKIFPQKDPEPKEGREKSGKGRIFRTTIPRRIIRIPAPRVKPPRRFPMTWSKEVR